MEAAHEGSWWWFLLDYCLRTTICKRLIPGDFLGGKSWEEVFLKRCHLSRQVACPDDPGAEIALWWLMRPSVAVNSAICNHFSYRPFGNHFGKFLFEQCRFWGKKSKAISPVAGKDLGRHKLEEKWIPGYPHKVSACPSRYFCTTILFHFCVAYSPIHRLALFQMLRIPLSQGRVKSMDRDRAVSKQGLLGRRKE